jgi:hypothetical protein
VSTLQQLIKNVHNVPSIPTREQSYGYDVAPNDPNKLVLQVPAYAVGFTGKGNDTVGPLDYDPKVPNNSKEGPKFGTKPFRSQRSASQPMMGSYEAEALKEEVGLFENPRNTYVIALNAAKLKKRSACFESRVSRDLVSAAERERISHPGPGHYELPGAIKVPYGERGAGSFLSSQERFNNVLYTFTAQVFCILTYLLTLLQAEALRLETAPAPGTYDPLTSDFDLSRLKIVRRKKLLQRSQWTQDISFQSRDRRFPEKQAEDSGPPPCTEFPTNMGYQAAKLRSARRSSFSGPDRFSSPKPRTVKMQPKDIFERGAPLPFKEPVPVKHRPRYTHVFSNGEARFKDPEPPTPG